MTTPTVEEIKVWSIDEVVNWAKSIIDEEEANKLKQQKVNGISLLVFTEQHFRDCGIPVGPSSLLYSILSEIKGTTRLLVSNLKFDQHWKFSVNSTIRPQDKYFIIDPTPWITKFLLPKIMENSVYCIMLVAPRANGKSTCMMRAIEMCQQIHQFHCFDINFEKGYDFRQPSLFWQKLSDDISLQLGSQITFNSGASFERALNKNSPDSPFTSQVIIFIDEFDLILINTELKNEFLGVIRGMKASREKYRLQSLIAVGTYSLLSLEDNNIDSTSPYTMRSPFNAKDTLSFPFLSHDETFKLFEMFSNIRREPIDTIIIHDIFEHTRGHRGLTCFLGKLLDEDFRYMNQGILPSYSQWDPYFRLKITERVNEYPTMSKMIAQLCKNNNLSSVARQILSTTLLAHNNLTLRAMNTNELSIMKWLNSEGVVISEEPGMFKITSPLVRQILIEKVITIDKRKCPQMPIPRILPNNRINIPQIIYETLKFFNKNQIQQAYQMSFKRNRGNQYPRDAPVPEEAVYHFELFTILSNWFPLTIAIQPEVVPYPHSNTKSESRQRCDLIIIEGINKILIEIEASDPPKEMNEHAITLVKHKNALKANEAWLIYFAPANNFDWSVVKHGCSCIAVYHNDDASLWNMLTDHDQIFGTITH